LSARGEIVVQRDEDKVRRTCICRRRSGGMEPVAVLRSQLSVREQFQDGSEDISVHCRYLPVPFILRPYVPACVHCMIGRVRRP